MGTVHMVILIPVSNYTCPYCICNEYRQREYEEEVVTRLERFYY